MQRTSSPAALAREHTKYFPATRYGYAGAIKTGKVVVEKGQLAIETPPMSLNNLPFYSCDIASILMTRVLTREGIDCGQMVMPIAVQPTQDDGTIYHKICVGQENDSIFFVGVTPIDQLLHIFPFGRANIPFGFGSELMPAAYNPFHGSRNQETMLQERPSWPIPGCNSSVIPLFARQQENRLELCEFGVAAQSGTLYLCLVARIMEGQGRIFSFSGKWAASIIIETATSNIQQLIELVSKPSLHPATSLQNLLETGQANYATHRENETLYNDGLGLFAEGWPFIVTFIQKLPVEAIQRAIEE